MEKKGPNGSGSSSQWQQQFGSNRSIELTLAGPPTFSFAASVRELGTESRKLPTFSRDISLELRDSAANTLHEEDEPTVGGLVEDGSVTRAGAAERGKNADAGVPLDKNSSKEATTKCRLIIFNCCC